MDMDINKLWQMAAEGDAEAQYLLGKHLLEQADPDDEEALEEALEMIMLSASQEHPGAAFLFAWCLDNGVGTEEDPNTAFSLYLAVLGAGVAEAEKHLIALVDSGRVAAFSSPATRETFKKYMSLSAEELYKSGMEMCYGKPTRIVEGLGMFGYAAMRGSAEARAEMERFAAQGLRAENMTVDVLNALAAADDVSAQVILAGYYEIGMGVPRDIERAIELYSRAYELGHRDGGVKLASFALCGLIEGGAERAIEIFEDIYNTLVEAERESYAMCLVTLGTREALERAREVYAGISSDTAALALADVEAVLNSDDVEAGASHMAKVVREQLRLITEMQSSLLGSRDGEIIPTDDEEEEGNILFKMLEGVAKQAENARSSDDPNVRCSYGLGLMNNPETREEGLRIIVEAAEDGSLAAAVNASNFYLTGIGCEQDNERAAHWLTVAAEGGVPYAQLTLAQACLAVGEIEEALIWFERAADGGDEEAAIMLEQLRADLEERDEEMFEIAGAGERHDIFISWNHLDKEFMDALVEGIESYSFSDDLSRDERAHAHYRAWQSDRDASGLIDKCVRRAIGGSKFFVVLLSKNSVKSRWVREEVRFALERVKGGEWSEDNIIAIYMDEQASAYLASLEDENDPFYMLKDYTGAFISSSAVTDVLVRDVCERIKRGFEAEAIYRYITNQTKESERFKFLLRNQYDLGMDGVSTEELQQRKTTIIQALLSFEDGYLSRDLYRMNDGGTPVSERDVVGGGRSFFVYGEGGVGKSLYISNLVRTNFKAPNFFIRINLKDYEAPLLDGGHLTAIINRELNRYLTDADEYRSERPLVRARGKGGENSVTVILDGIDEISEESRASLIKMIYEYRKSERRDRFIFAARRSMTYHDLVGAFPEGLDLYELRGINEADQMRLYDVIRQNVGELAYVKSDEEMKADFFLSLGELSEEIRKNPMLLSNLIFIYLQNRGKDFPKKKYEIVDKSVGIIIGELEAERGVRFEYAPYISGERLSSMLSFVAYRKLGGTSLDLEQLLRAYMREIMGAECQRRGDDPDEVGSAIFKFLSRRAIISKEKITHDIFTAYFACLYAYNRIYKTVISEKRVDFADKLYLEDALAGGYDEDLAREDGAWPEIASELIMKLDFEIHSVDPRHAMNERNRSHPVFDETLRLALTERGISEKAIGIIEAMAAEPEGFYFVDFIRQHLPSDR